MTSISSIANRIFQDYDRNHNGVISLRDRQWGEGDESSYTRSSTNVGLFEDTVTLTRFSQRSMFQQADRNNDDYLTRAELEDYISRYDRNHNGYLDSYAGPYQDEEKRFNSENRESVYIESSHTVPHLPLPLWPTPVPHHDDHWPYNPPHHDDHHDNHGPIFNPPHHDDHGHDNHGPINPPQHGGHVPSPPQHGGGHGHGKGIEIKAAVGSSAGISVKVKK